MERFQVDVHRMTAIKAALDNVIGKCSELAVCHYQACGEAGVKDCLEHAVSRLTEWSNRTQSSLSDTAGAWSWANRESVYQWIYRLDEMLSVTARYLVVDVRMDPAFPQAAEALYEALYAEFKKLDGLVRSEKELYH